MGLIVRTRAGWRRIRPLFGKGLFPVGALTTASITAGLAEAGVLLMVANIAAVMVLHGDEVRGSIGIASLRLSIGNALITAAVLAGIRLVLQLVVAWLPARISAEVQAQLRRDLIFAFTGAAWAVQAADRDGHLQELMTDQVAQSSQAVLNIANAVSAAAMFAALLASALSIDPAVAIVVFVSALALFQALRPVDRLGRVAARDMSEATMTYASGISETVRLAEEIQVFGTAGAQRQRVAELIEIVRNASYRSQLTARIVQSVYQSLVLLLIIGGLGGLYAVGHGQLADLGTVVLMLVRASAYGQQFQAANHAVIQTVPYLERIEAAIDTYRASAPVDEGVALPAIDTVALDGVGFAYRRGLPVLRCVSFEVRAGEAIGIIGPTGAGKSTLTQLLMRLREPDSGVYRINGDPAQRFAKTDWQARVAYVPQEPKVFEGTVADNIRYYREIDESSVRRAAALAHIHTEIAAMPAGYATVIGQRADAVSGGQRQRICLARALVGEPELLLLDEPTSALDLLSEAAIRDSLAALHGTVTLFVVAHRLPILKICDRVLVLENGAVRSFAAPDELARSDAFFRQVMKLAAQSA